MSNQIDGFHGRIKMNFTIKSSGKTLYLKRYPFARCIAMGITTESHYYRKVLMSNFLSLATYQTYPRLLKLVLIIPSRQFNLAILHRIVKSRKRRIHISPTRRPTVKIELAVAFTLQKPGISYPGRNFDRTMYNSRSIKQKAATFSFNPWTNFLFCVQYSKSWLHSRPIIFYFWKLIHRPQNLFWILPARILK